MIPTRNRQDETNDVQIEIEKIDNGKEEKKKIIIRKNARKKTGRNWNTHTCRLASSAGGV